jgi:hypothetical protein
VQEISNESSIEWSKLYKRKEPILFKKDFFEKLKTKLNLHSHEDWYRVTKNDLIELEGGAQIYKTINGNLYEGTYRN